MSDETDKMSQESGRMAMRPASTQLSAPESFMMDFSRIVEVRLNCSRLFELSRFTNVTPCSIQLPHLLRRSSYC